MTAVAAFLALHVLPSLELLVKGAILAGVGQFTLWLRSRNNGNTVNETMKVLAELVDIAVSKIDQVYVQSRRDNNGKLDKNFADIAKSNAVNELRAMTGPEQLKGFAKRLGITEDRLWILISGLIEKTVGDRKVYALPSSSKTEQVPSSEDLKKHLEETRRLVEEAKQAVAQTQGSSPAPTPLSEEPTQPSTPEPTTIGPPPHAPDQGQLLGHDTLNRPSE